MEGVARISSAVFVHANGLGSAFQVAIHSRTSVSSAATLFVDAAFEQLIAEESEPALDLVDPRRSGRGELQGEPRVFGQPVPDGGGLVGGEVVTDQVHVEFGGYGFVDGGEEFLELHRAVLAVQGGDHRAVGDVERSEQAARYRST